MAEQVSTKPLTGGCRCGAIRYEMDTLIDSAICHCSDCRRSAGAPLVAWLGVKAAHFRILSGEARRWSSNGQAERYFCATCGTGLYYLNPSMIQGNVGVLTATLDDPAAAPPEFQIQVAERIGWVAQLDRLPGFARFPGAD